MAREFADLETTGVFLVFLTSTTFPFTFGNASSIFSIASSKASIASTESSIRGERFIGGVETSSIFDVAGVFSTLIVLITFFSLLVPSVFPSPVERVSEWARLSSD